MILQWLCLAWKKKKKMTGGVHNSFFRYLRIEQNCSELLQKTGQLRRSKFW